MNALIEQWIRLKSNQSCIAPSCSNMNKKQLFIVLQLSQRRNLLQTLTVADDEMESADAAPLVRRSTITRDTFPGEYNVLNGL